MLKSIDSPPYQRSFIAACSNSPSLSHNIYTTCYTMPSSQPKTKYLARSFQCLLLAPCKSIVGNIGRSTKDVKPLGHINALFAVPQRQPYQDLNACHRKLAAGKSLDPVLGREPALALGSLLHANHWCKGTATPYCDRTAENHSNY